MIINITTKMVKLILDDTTTFEVDIKIAQMMQTVKDMMADLPSSEAMDIPLPNITNKVLTKVLEYLKYHENDAPSNENDEVDLTKSAKQHDSTINDKWDVEFVNMDNSLLFEIILAANYLNVRSLLNVCCKAVANMIKGKTPEEIRKHFGIVNDFTPEEEEQVRKENEWID